MLAVNALYWVLLFSSIPNLRYVGYCITFAQVNSSGMMAKTIKFNFFKPSAT